MLSLLPTVAIEVGVETENGPDSYGDIQSSWVFETVTGCLVTPVSSIARPGPFERLNETRIEVYIPTAFKKSLRNARIKYFGNEYKVIGNPIPYPWSPLSWDRIVTCEEVILND